MKYRAEIDGLRTLAVLPVIAYHLGIPGISGGFTGVDIFFVISGYLISGIIYRDFLENKFSYLDFYKRRCLRILPPLLIVLISTYFIGYNFLLPHQLVELGKSGVAAILFSSNFFFWSQSGYFDGPAEMKPLLHTWSLAVEEQFYILFPIFLMAALKYVRIKIIYLIVLIIIMSFALSFVGVKVRPNMAFYFLPTRAWELGVGAFLAISSTEKFISSQNKFVVNILSVMGLLLIFIGFFWLNSTKPFPSYNALYPCIGAALIISTGKDAIVGKILSLKPVVYIGMISYCLYLWHWPIIVYTNLLLALSPHNKIFFVLVTTFGLSVLSRYLIELPVKKYSKLIRPIRIVQYSASSILLLAALSSIFIFIPHYGRAFSKEAIAMSDFANYRLSDEYNYQFRLGSCFINGNNGMPDVFDKNACLVTQKNKRNYILIGDSHGAHLWRAISNAAGSDVNLIQVTASGCKPIEKQDINNKCSQLMSFIYDKFIENNKIEGIIISARWSEKDFPSLISTVDSTRKILPNIYVLGPVAEYYGILPDLLAYQINGRSGLARKMLNHDIKKTDKKMSDVMRINRIQYISVYDILCPRDKCEEISANGKPTAFDYGHLTLSGATDVAAGIVPILNKNNFFSSSRNYN